jgi:hypothetical protein
LIFLGTLNKEEFIEAFESILDQHEYRQLLEKLFDKVFLKKTKINLLYLFSINLVEYKRDRTY